MATALLSAVPSVLNNGDSITGWNGDTFSLEPDIKVQGTNSIACTQTTNGANDVYVTGFTGFSINTTDVHFRLWFNITYIGDLAPSNKIQVWCTDGTNTAYWTWTKGDNYSGGWAQAVIYTGDTPTSGTKPTGTITQVGMRMNTSSKPRNVPANAWYDYWTYGNGFIVTGGTSGDPLKWSDIAAADTDITNTAYNIVSIANNGSVSVRGDVQIGDGTSTTYFEPDGEVVIFPTEQVSTTLYKVSFVDSASNLTNVNISGGSMSSQSASYRFSFDASDPNLNAFSITGVQIQKASTIDVDHGTMSGLVFDNCQQVTSGSATFTNTTFKNYVGTTGAYLWPSDSSKVSGLRFEVCDNDIEYDATSDTTSPTFTDIIHDDTAGDYDVNNTSGGSVTIVLSGTSNGNSFNSGGSNVTFSAPKQFKFTLSVNITGYEWRLYNVTAEGSMAGAVEQDGQESATQDNQTYNYNYSGDQPIAVQIISQPDEDYEEIIRYYTLTNNNQDVTIILTPDNNN